MEKKKYILAAAIGIVSFIVGAAGLYFAMPSINPDRADAARVRLDSLAAVDSSSVRDAGEFVPGDSAGSALQFSVLDSATLHLPMDSVRVMAERADTMRSYYQSRLIAVLTDSLNRTSLRLSEATLQKAALEKQAEVLQERLTAKGVQRVDAAGMSSTLSKLEDKELRPVLQNMEETVLEQIYLSSSSRNQSRLLKALNPERAAGLVQRLMRGDPARNGQATAAGTVKTAAGEGT